MHSLQESFTVSASFKYQCPEAEETPLQRGLLSSGGREAAMAEADVESGHRESGDLRDILSGVWKSLMKQPCF